MGETISVSSLYLMLAALLLFPTAYWAFLASRPLRVAAPAVIAAALGVFAVLAWLLARGWAGQPRPGLPTLAVIAGAALVLPLICRPILRLARVVAGGEDRALPTPVRPLPEMYDLLVPLSIYALAVWSLTALLAIWTGMSLDRRFVWFALLLAPAAWIPTLPRPRPLLHGVLVLLCLEWLYAAGCWGLVASWTALAGGSEGVLRNVLLACAGSWLVWALCTGRTPLNGRLAMAVLARALARAGRAALAWVAGLPPACARLVRRVGLASAALVVASGRAAMRVPPALGSMIARVARGAFRLLVALRLWLSGLPSLLWRPLCRLALVLFGSMAVVGRAAPALPGLSGRAFGRLIRLLIAAGTAAAAVLRAAWRGVRRMVSGVPARLAIVAMALLAAIVGLGCILSSGLAGGLELAGRAAWRVPILAVGAARLLARGLAATLTALARGILALLPVAWRGLRGAALAVVAIGAAIIKAVLRLPAAIARTVVQLARDMFRLLIALVLALARLLARLWGFARGLALGIVTLLAAAGRGALALPGRMALAGRSLVRTIGAARSRAAAGLGAGWRRFWPVVLILLTGLARAALALAARIAGLVVALVRGLADLLALAGRVAGSAARRAPGLALGTAALLVRGLVAALTAAALGILALPPLALRGLRWSALALAGAASVLVRSARISLARLARIPSAVGRILWRCGVAVVAALAALARALPVLAALAGRVLFGLALAWAAAARAIGRALAAAPAIAWRVLTLLALVVAAMLKALGWAAWTILELLVHLPAAAFRLLRRLVSGLAVLAAAAGRAMVALPPLLGRGLRWLACLLLSVAVLARRSANAHRSALAILAFPALIGLGYWGYLHRPIPPSPPQLRIVAGSGFASFEPILRRWGQQNGVDVQISYKGSLDIMMMLEKGSIKADAIWEGDSLWTSLGDKQGLVKNSRSIMCSPIVFGVKKSVAQRLGWIGRDVSMQQILEAAESRRLRVLMTSATQSNSGASAYFGFLYAFAGNPEVLTADDLEDAGVRTRVKRILGTVNRTSDSSGWMRELFLRRYDRFDAMFNYESHVLEMNANLAARGDEPLYIVYPVEGLGMADFPFSFVRNKNAEREPLFRQLQAYLLSDDVQKEIAAKGRRVGPLCDQVDPAIFRAEWGADAHRVINSFKFPSAPVIRQALALYQTEFRKPSYTVYALDFSGSMEGRGKDELTKAMRTLLDQQTAAGYLLQASPDDVTAVVIFDDLLMNDPAAVGWTVKGNDPAALTGLLGRIEQQPVGHFTDIYLPIARALQLMQEQGTGDAIPAIILLTDGQSNRGSLDDIKRAAAATGLDDVPVYGITFGEADAAQLGAIAELTDGRVFDGTKDLVGAFRKAKGNN